MNRDEFDDDAGEWLPCEGFERMARNALLCVVVWIVVCAIVRWLFD